MIHVMIKLSKRQKAFADAYLINGGNATDAAKTAGYSPHNIGANAAKTLKNPKIQAYLQERLQPIERETNLEVDKAIAHLLAIGMGQEVEAHNSTYDNQAGEMLQDLTITYVPSPKQQVEALELYLKYKGVLRNASKELEDAQARKAAAEADIAEAKAKDIKQAAKQGGAIIVDDIPEDSQATDDQDQ